MHSSVRVYAKDLSDVVAEKDSKIKIGTIEEVEEINEINLNFYSFDEPKPRKSMVEVEACPAPPNKRSAPTADLDCCPRTISVCY